MRLIIDLLAFLMPYGTLAYIFMFVILIACGFGLPLPEDIVLITGGMLASHGVTRFSLTLAVCMAGVLIGDGIIFCAGSIMGERIKKIRLIKFILKGERDTKIQYWFSKYGDKVIFLARFMPGFRTPLFLTAGIYRVPVWKFFLLDGFAALISVPLWIWLGFFFGSNLELLEHKIHQLKVGIYGILGIVLVSAIVFYYVKKQFSDKFM